MPPVETEEVNSTQAPEGVAEGTASQDSGSPETDKQNQNGTPAQVEGKDSEASSQPGASKQPSEYYWGRKVKSLEKMVTQQTQQLQAVGAYLQQFQQQQMQPTAPRQGEPKKGFSLEDFVANPDGVLQKLLDEREQKLRNEIPKTLEELQQKNQYATARQEAENLLNTNEYVRRDPTAFEKLDEILKDKEFNLDSISIKHPLEAAKLALFVFQAKHQPGVMRRNASSPTKGEMGSNATAVRTGAQPNIADEFKQLQTELVAQPYLANDPKWVARLTALKQRHSQSNT